MKAIDVRFNKDMNTKTEYMVNYLKRLGIEGKTEEQIKEKMSGSGCPNGDHYVRGCFDFACFECWKQEPYQYKSEHPDWYEGEETECCDEENPDGNEDYNEDDD